MDSRKLTYTNSHEDMGHQCKNVVVICMDFRFRQDLQNLLGRAGFSDFDLIALPGASKAIIDDESRNIVFGAIDISAEKHHAKRIIVVDHIDCGAYGGSGKFAGESEEKEFHAEQLKKAKEILKEKYPLLEVVTLYLDWDQLQSV